MKIRLLTRMTAAASTASNPARWAPLLFVLVSVTTVACVGYLLMEAPVLRALPLSATAPAIVQRNDAWPAQNPVPEPEPADDADRAVQYRPRGMIPESPWQQARERELQVQRQVAEMMPLTPGVTMDQYAVGSDDVEADVSASQADDE